MSVMLITSQGFGHFTKNINNQDFGIETERMLLVLDGCSEATCSESGTKQFGQLFSQKEGCESVENFENNVREVFEDIMVTPRKYYPTQKDFVQKYIMENLLFTILACFETEDSYIVKLFGDGYIITENKQGIISYIKFNYGKCPPYFAYKYCDLPEYSNYEFKTFKFDKKYFSKVGIGTDGILPIVKGAIPKIESFISQANKLMIDVSIRNQRQSFFDDITFGLFDGGKKNEESI